MGLRKDMLVLDSYQKPRKTGKTLPINDFMAAIKQTTWYRCANEREQGEFIDIIVTNLGGKGSLGLNEASDLVALAINYNQRASSPGIPLSTDSALVPTQITMAEILKQHPLP